MNNHKHSLDCLTIVHGRSYCKVTGQEVQAPKSKYLERVTTHRDDVERAIEESGGAPLLIVVGRGSGATMGVRQYARKRMTSRSPTEIATMAASLGLPKSSYASASYLENPFRAPHYTVSPAGLVGTAKKRTGELQIAGRGGLLFLDDLAEWNPKTIEALAARRSEYPGTMIVAVAYKDDTGHRPLYGTVRRLWNETPGVRAFQRSINPITVEI